MPQNPTAQGSTPLGSLFVIPVALTFALAWGVLISVPGVAFPDEYVLPIPAEVLPPLIPDDNPLSAAKVELGQKLYFDPRLSVDNTVSCATCHDPRQGFADGKPVGEGIKQQKGARNSPTVLNAAYYEQQFWDGRAEMLEDQAILPLINPIEMAMPSHGAVEDKLRKLPEYPPLFQKAFGKPEITIRRVGQALASFERTLVSFSAPIDRFLKGDKSAISESAQRGWTLFNGKARCNTCYGINEGPRVHDAQLKEVLGVMLKVQAGAYSFEAANARHEHEYHLWETIKLPEGKVIIPGVITHASNIVEHPEFIAERIVRYAKLVGRENVIAGADCGFSSQATYNPEVHPTVVWAKFQAMAEGARLATQQLWR